MAATTASTITAPSARRPASTIGKLPRPPSCESSDAYDELQRDVMRYAEQVTRHINVDDVLFARLKQTLNDRQIVELAMTVGIANFTNRVTETLRLELP